MIKKSLVGWTENNVKIVWLALYTIVTTLLIFSIAGIEGHLICVAMLQLAAASSLLVYYAFIQKAKIPYWIIAPYWFTNLLFSPLINTFWYSNPVKDPRLILFVLLIHITLIVFIFPLVLSISYIFLISTHYIISINKFIQLWPLNHIALYAQLGLGLFGFIITIHNKLTTSAVIRQNFHLKKQLKSTNNVQYGHLTFFKQLNKDCSKDCSKDPIEATDGLKDIEKYVEYGTNHLFYNQDFKSIVHAFSYWTLFLRKQARSKDYMLLMPTEITIDALSDKVKIALQKEIEIGRMPRLLVTKQDAHLPNQILCDVNQMVNLWVTATLRMIDLDCFKTQYVSIKLYHTQLQYNLNNFREKGLPSSLKFPAMAMVISNATVHPAALPKIEPYYQDITNDHLYSNNQTMPKHWDFSIKVIEGIVHTHYGYLAMPNQCVLLLVIPYHAADIHDQMIAQLPSTVEKTITVEEENHSTIALQTFHEYVCEVAYVNAVVIAEILLLLKRCYGFQRHPSGELLCIRAIGIAEYAAMWLIHFPRPIYAALLYDLARYTRLPLSYIKANYDSGVFYIVETLLRIDKRVALKDILFGIEHCSNNEFNHLMIATVYIKLAERLYDLEHATGYTNLETVQHMAQETLSTYLELTQALDKPDITAALMHAAKQALERCKEP